MPPHNDNTVHTFHANSRLHFIGSWRARYEEFLDALEPHLTNPSPPRGAAPTAAPRVIAHVDMDCFFAAVAMRSRPHLSPETPLAVTWGSKASRRGEISSANYPARAFGVRAGMWLDDALVRCPDLVTVPYEFDTYAEVALEVYRILFDVARGAVIGVSVDEAYADITRAVYDANGDAKRVAEDIRARVFAKTSCACSVGVGSNRLVARLATKVAKPNGSRVVEPGQGERRFVAETSLADVPGLGRKAMEKFKALEARVGAKLERCEDVVEKVSAKALNEALGVKLGTKVFDAVRGVDASPWVVRPERKSVGAQMSWGVRCATMDVAEDFVRQLAADVSRRLQQLKKVGGVVHLKLWRALPNAAELMQRKSYAGHGPCDVLSRSKIMLKATAETEIIAKEVVSVLHDLRHAQVMQPEEIRGLGIMVNKLEDIASVKSPGAKNQPTIAQMFARKPIDTGATDEELTAPATSARRMAFPIAGSDEELAETESERSESDSEDVDFTQSLTQNNQDWNVFENTEELALDEEIALDDKQSIQRAYQSAARCFAWNRYELARLNISKRRRETLSEDIHARKTVSRSIDIITEHAKRRKERSGVDGLREFLDFSRALCRRQEIIDTNADFIIAWLGAIGDIERALA